MTIIDVHNHLGRDLADDLSQTSEGLLASMDEAGIDRAVVFAFEGSPDVSKDNEQVLREAGRHPKRLIPFWVLVPSVPPVEREGILSRISALATGRPAIKGIVLNPTMHTYKAAHPFIQQVCKTCGDLGLPVMVHHTGQWADDLGAVQELVRTCQNVNFIIPNPTWTAGAVALLKDIGNVYFDMSKSYGEVTYRILVQAVGTGRVLFGTETPKMDPVLELAKLRAYDFTGAEMDDVLFRNAARLLNLSV
jgi:predicted TIM-barrel fold metal-dependent hydrolase